MKKPNVDPEICQEPRPGLPYIDSSNVFAQFSHGVDKKQEPSENTEQYFAFFSTVVQMAENISEDFQPITNP